MISKVQEIIKKCISKISQDHSEILLFEIPKHLQNDFDIATNICLIESKKLKVDLNELCNKFCEILNLEQEIEFSKPVNGFINIKFSNKFIQDILNNCISKGENYGQINQKNPLTINLEFCSANPTGPIHIGHLRNIIIGQSLCEIIKKNGHNVKSEYYINDAGGQIKTLKKSIQTRFNQINSNSNIQLEDDCYPGEYIVEIAKSLPINFDFNDKSSDSILTNLVMNQIKSTLKKLDVNFDLFKSEQSLIDAGLINQLLDTLKQKNLTYTGIPCETKSKNSKIEEQKEVLLFRSTMFSDAVDRSLTKQDGSLTYLATDGAYIIDKLNRKFDKLIMILGSDHKGYKDRLKGLVSAISEKTELEIKFSEMVNFIKNGEQIKMSKRSGNFLSVDDVLEQIDKDILKFNILEKKSNTIINFDLELAKEQSKENPIFYVQYASSRCSSIIEKLKDIHIANPVIQDALQPIVIKILFFENIVKKSYQTLEPHVVVEYLIDLAEGLHKIWQSSIELKNTTNNQVAQGNKLVFLAYKNTISTGLKLLNIKALDSM